MRHQVLLSKFSFISTILCIIVLIGLMFINQPPVYIKLFIVVLLIGMLVAGLFYMPLSIGADKDGIYINRSLKCKILPMENIKSIRLCPPTMGAKRICASGGFLGYWGWFSERDLGKYFAYYGRSKDCFLVELHDGRKYMLGCSNPQEIVKYIKSQL